MAIRKYLKKDESQSHAGPSTPETSVPTPEACVEDIDEESLKPQRKKQCLSSSDKKKIYNPSFLTS